MPQRSDEWKALRLGRVCASRAADMLATIGKGEAAARRNLRVDLMLERITGRSQERSFINQAMQDGIDREPNAVAIYEALTGTLLDTTVGFCAHDSLMAGCSPDGVIGDFDGIVEIKCPTPAIHLEYLTTGRIPDDYRKQITHSLWVTGAPFCDWISYQPQFPEKFQVVLQRVRCVDLDIPDHARKTRLFLEDVDRACEAFNTLADPIAQMKAVAC